MGRELKRVPLDFDYNINEVWEGYCPSLKKIQDLFGKEYPFLYTYKNENDICVNCEKNCGECSESADYCFWYNKEKRRQWFYEPPTGEGYQLWGTTSEGEPRSPVFETLDELCEWCETNDTVFANMTATKEEWKQMLSNNNVHYNSGNMIFI